MHKAQNDRNQKQPQPSGMAGAAGKLIAGVMASFVVFAVGAILFLVASGAGSSDASAAKAVVSGAAVEVGNSVTRATMDE